MGSEERIHVETLPIDRVKIIAEFLGFETWWAPESIKEATLSFSHDSYDVGYEAHLYDAVSVVANFHPGIFYSETRICGGLPRECIGSSGTHRQEGSLDVERFAIVKAALGDVIDPLIADRYGAIIQDLAMLLGVPAVYNDNDASPGIF